MNDPLKLPLAIYQRVAAASLLIPLLLYALTPITYLLWLELAFLWHLLSIAWVGRRRGVWQPKRVATAFCLVEWSAAFAMTAVEGWAIHVTPIMCLGPVVLAIQVVDRTRYRHLIIGAVAVIAAMSVLARLIEPGPIRDAASQRTVDVFAIIVTPGLAGIVALLAWLNQAVMAERKDLLLRSRSRLFRADESARASFGDFSTRMQHRLREIRDHLAKHEGQRSLATSCADIQDISTEIRTAAHGLGIRAFDLADSDDLAALVSTWPWPVVVHAATIGDRDPVVDSVARAVIIDAFVNVASPVSSTVTLTVDARTLRVEVDHTVGGPVDEAIDEADDYPIDLGTLTTDRLDAIGGVVQVSAQPRSEMSARLPADDVRHARLDALLPLVQPPTGAATESSGDLRADLRQGVILPLVSLISGVAVWATAVREPEMLGIAVQIAVLFAMPCVLAVALARTHPQTALALFVGSYWTTAIVIANQLNILKFFAAIALLAPLFIALPHVTHRAYTILAFGTGAVISLTVASARLTTQLTVADDAPGIVTDIVVVILVPVCSAIVLQISGANYTALANAANTLARSRRRVVEAADVAQRRIERDLHDGTQQRLVSAALRTQIATRVDDPSTVEANVDAAVIELDKAISSLAGLAAGGSSPDVAGGLGSALRQLAASSPLLVRVEFDGRQDDVPDRLWPTIWFCCAEALTNAIKHAGEFAEVDIALHCGETEVCFDVADNGRGFPIGRSKGQGLHNMSERVEQVGGKLTISSQLGAGTSVRGRIPRRPAKAFRPADEAGTGTASAS